MKQILFCLVMVSLTGCMKPSVQARSSYTSRRDLASYVIDTPDPEKSTKRLGQRIWVTWDTPTYDDNTHIDVFLRYQDGQERKEIHPVSSRIGEMYVEISPREVALTGGLLSYKINLVQKDQVLATSKHKLWVEKVEISDVR